MRSGNWGEQFNIGLDHVAGWGCTNVHVEEEVNGEMIVEIVEVGLVEVAQEKFNIGLSHISGWAGQLIGNRCAVGNQVVARVNELHTGVPECPIEHPGYKSG